MLLYFPMIIGVDMDSVIAEIIRPIDLFHNRQYGTNITYDDHESYDLRLYWNCSLEDMYRRIFEFYDSPEFEETKPVAGSQSALGILAEDHELHLITARPYDVEAQSRKWLDKHFPRIFKEIHHTNLISKGGKETSVKKSEICRKMGATVMIDDHIDYILDCAESAITSYLFPAPWNRGKKIVHPRIRQITGWEEAVELINGL